MKSVPSIISADLTVTGDLVSGGEIQVDGVVEGDIRCKSLIIGANGRVKGEIDADVIRLHGQVTGQVRAQTVYFAATSRMVGDVTHESLAIEPGAFIEGHCRRMAEKGAVKPVTSNSTTTADTRKFTPKPKAEEAPLVLKEEAKKPETATVF